MSAPIAGDALLLALAAQYRTMTDAVNAFDEEGTRWSGSVSNYLQDQQDSHHYRREGILDAIAAIKADGLAGAMVQLEVLCFWNDAGVAAADSVRRQQSALTEAMIWSIHDVLGGLAGRAVAEGINAMKPYNDVHRSDIPALIIEWRAMLVADGLGYAEKSGTKRSATP